MVEADTGDAKIKAADKVKPVAFRQIAFVEAPVPPAQKPAAGPKLTVETSLIREEMPEPEEVRANPTVTATVSQPTTAPAPTLGALLKIRKQVAEQQKQVIDKRNLDAAHLRTAWDEYIAKLSSQKSLCASSSGMPNCASLTNTAFDCWQQ